MNQAQKDLFRAYLQAATDELNAGAVGPFEALLKTYGLIYEGEQVQLEGYPLKASFSRENLAEVSRRNCEVRAGYRELCEVLAAVDDGGHCGTELTKALSDSMKAEWRGREIEHELKALRALEFNKKPVPALPKTAANVKRRYEEARATAIVAEEAFEHARPFRRKKAAIRLERARRALERVEKEFREVCKQEAAHAETTAENEGLARAQREVQSRISALIQEQKMLDSSRGRLQGERKKQQRQREEEKRRRQARKTAPKAAPKAPQKRAAEEDLEPEI